jgi:2-keto-3-deoxy-L-rhamnonate aldolase RhmA
MPGNIILAELEVGITKLFNIIAITYFMNGKELRSALRNGEKVYGSLIVSTSPKWLDIIGQLNLDFVFIDTEHVAIGRELLSWMCHAYRGKSLAPIVRIPAPDPYQACMVLDGGAQGIIAPYVESAEQVRQLAGAVKTRPLKGRKLDDFLSGKKELEPELASYIEKHNHNHVLIVNIESRPAIEQLDDILAVPGLDAVLIGPHDLTCNLGIPEQYEHPEFLEAVETIITKARNAGVGAGIHVFYNYGIGQEIQWGQMGANLIVHSGDINRFTQSMQSDILTLRAAFGEEKVSASEDINI